ncbi:hypothetical protein [Flammeovirga sp. SJP92]|uniref:hypothetical protein n=1 Tax=Flammeovirga sp. SJP92 TaxID=1775430 RepID=UPI0007877451|nr:hypothetical protein [Flammeovirga sp. SJP92]KXX70342.1 hypothetical protein AVL50_12100 [Flammeovirga sp. SJP92]
MKKLLFILTITLISTACQPYKDVIIDPFAPKFVTYDQTRMYFKNVRASYYDKVDLPQTDTATHMNVLLYNKAVQDSTQAIINLHLVTIDSNDNAFIMLAPNEFFKGYQLFKVHWVDHGNELKGEIRYKQGGMADQFLFTSEIYNLLNKDDVTFEIEFGDKRVPFLDTIEEKNAFRITMIDFYRLVTLL